MLVLMRTTIAGPSLTASAGCVVEVSEELAASLMEGGYASPVNDPAERVATVGSESEQATIPKGRKK